ncbi:MAG TPA: hypothetical protein VFV71_03090 [Burkholderiales bacterium]|nr:hypothetical protein [Burkholderiales bacterium]
MPDCKDQCTGTPAGANADANGCPVKLTEKAGITPKLNFDAGKAGIKPEFADEIGNVAAFIPSPGA